MPRKIKVKQYRPIRFNEGVQPGTVERAANKRIEVAENRMADKELERRQQEREAAIWPWK